MARRIKQVGEDLRYYYFFAISASMGGVVKLVLDVMVWSIRLWYKEFWPLSWNCNDNVSSSFSHMSAFRIFMRCWYCLYQWHQQMTPCLEWFNYNRSFKLKMFLFVMWYVMRSVICLLLFLIALIQNWINFRAFAHNVLLNGTCPVFTHEFTHNALCFLFSCRTCMVFT